MPQLTLDTVDSFPAGTPVRVKRHGYMRHYEGEVHSVIDDVVTVDLYYSDTTLDGVRLRIFGPSMRFYVDGDYATVATIGTKWADIPHPQSEEWLTRIGLMDRD